jgi:hypothetical protein
LLTTIEQNSDGGFIDFISKNALDHLSGIENVVQSVSLDYDLQTDNKGRLSQMTSSLGAGIYLLKYYYY